MTDFSGTRETQELKYSGRKASRSKEDFLFKLTCSNTRQYFNLNRTYRIERPKRVSKFRIKILLTISQNYSGFYRRF